VGPTAFDLVMTDDPPREDARWLAAFHAGERATLERCYREHVGRVASAAARVVGPVDAETVTHEVFYRLLSSAGMRESFRGGNLGAWLVQVVTRSAIDDLRRRRRERPEAAADEARSVDGSVDGELEAKILIERFRRERLPPEWTAVFEARFLRQITQRDAARELGIPRSTLVYQEQRVRALLERFLLHETEGR